jgi:hypothetical protein
MGNTKSKIIFISKKKEIFLNISDIKTITYVNTDQPVKIYLSSGENFSVNNYKGFTNSFEIYSRLLIDISIK